FRLRVVAPGNRDGLILEALRKRLQQLRRILRDVPPERQPTVQRLQRRRDLLHEVEIYRAQSARVHIRLGLSKAQIDRLVGADMQERPWIERRQLRELLLDQRN